MNDPSLSLHYTIAKYEGLKLNLAEYQKYLQPINPQFK